VELSHKLGLWNAFDRDAGYALRSEEIEDVPIAQCVWAAERKRLLRKWTTISSCRCEARYVVNRDPARRLSTVSEDLCTSPHRIESQKRPQPKLCEARCVNDCVRQTAFAEASFDRALGLLKGVIQRDGRERNEHKLGDTSPFRRGDQIELATQVDALYRIIFGA
jgi:hypothetical protein